MSHLLPSKAVTWQGCNIANLPSPTLQAFRLKATKSTGQTTPSPGQRLPSTPICTGFQLQVLVAEQIWPLQDVANLQSCHLTRLQHCKSTKVHTASLGVESNQEHWSNHPNSLAKGQSAQVPTAGLESKADLATARCWKSAAPANLTMLQHCTGKQIQHFELANLPMLH